MLGEQKHSSISEMAHLSKKKGVKVCWHLLSMMNLLKSEILTESYMVIAEFSAYVNRADNQNHQSYYEFTLGFKDFLDSPWLVWLSGLSAGLQTERSLVRFPAKAQTWVVDQVPGWGRVRGNQSISLPLFLPPFPSL